jgi:bifunctional DNase/RNase
LIHKLIDGVFFSNLVCEKDNEIIKIDSRTSDAIALSLRFDAPIFVDKSILDEAGFDDNEKYSEDINLIDDSFFKADTSDKTINELKDIKKISSNKIKKLLEKSIQNEDYEMAAKLRDELNIRKSIK